MFSLQIFKRIVLLLALAIFISSLEIMLNDVVIFFKVIKEWFVNVWKLFLFAEIFIASNEKIRTEELVQNNIKCFFSIVHLLTCFNCYPCNHKDELKEQKSRISFTFDLGVI